MYYLLLTIKKYSLILSDLNDVLQSIEGVAEWMDLGIELGIYYSTLQKINEEQRGHNKRCRREMLAAWLQGEDGAEEQTWSTLVDALKKINKMDLAERIEQEHQATRDELGKSHNIL